MAQEFPLSTIRHSTAHVLAHAVLDMFPDAKLAIGPDIEEGFYYDFDLPRTLHPEDLQEIEKRMQRAIKAGQKFECMALSKEEAIKLIKKQKQNYKLEIIEGLNLKKYTFYQNGNFIDLCQGPHVKSTANIKAFKLLRISGAYWRGDEKNKMLQRIYGTAFNNRDELDAYLNKLEEAKKRDHRTLGKELELFSIQDEIGPGLVLWHPKGARIRHIVEDYWKKAHYQKGYEMLYTPHLGREHLWQTSGHLDFYQENMFRPIDIENNHYYVKPMNCPFHIMIYKSKIWSYRELPFKTAELGTVYRYEKSGVLHGLLRVRGFTQDDAHIYCTKEQMPKEIIKVVEFCLEMLKTFGFEKYKVYLATRPDEKWVGEKDNWDKAEKALKEAIDKLKLPYELDEGGGAFYGPKIDIKIEDAIGRLWQCSTIQFDFNLPEQFDMTYMGADGERHRPFMIHRALLGSIERFFGILIEHYSGKFPVWLAPIQIKVLALNEAVHKYCEELVTQFHKAEIRAETDVTAEKLGYKIRLAQSQKVPYMLIIGNKEMEEKTLSVRSRDQGDLGSYKTEKFIEKILDENKKKINN